jgi:hypothetical protein
LRINPHAKLFAAQVRDLRTYVPGERGVDPLLISLLRYQLRQSAQPRSRFVPPVYVPPSQVGHIRGDVFPLQDAQTWTGGYPQVYPVAARAALLRSLRGG